MASTSYADRTDIAATVRRFRHTVKRTQTREHGGLLRQSIMYRSLRLRQCHPSTRLFLRPGDDSIHSQLIPLPTLFEHSGKIFQLLRISLCPDDHFTQLVSLPATFASSGESFLHRDNIHNLMATTQPQISVALTQPQPLDHHHVSQPQIPAI